MASVNPQLLRKIMAKLDIGRSRAYELVDAAVRRTSLPSNLAAIVVARDAGVSISRYATDEDLALIRSSGNLATATLQGPRSAPALAGVPPVQRVSARRGGTKQPRRPKGNAVWVVYGRNEPIRKSLFSFLRSVGLQPIEWNSALALTKKGSPYIGQVLDAGFGKAIATVVLFTADELARLKDEFFKRNSDSPSEKKLLGQPRPNVLFEAGMAFGHHPDTTVIVQVGKIRKITDLDGRHIVHLTNSMESRHQLIVKLRTARCPVDDTGSDWHTAGDFSLR